MRWKNEAFKTSKNVLKHFCDTLYLEKPTAATDIQIERVYIDEGRGFARIQGNEDIEPEKILGMYHLTRYAEIGDPFDPRVLEPGKIAQASGGILFVDEIGLLNKEAQYALIQGLQEKHFTPTNSRMTFPIDFLFVSTTNSINEFQKYSTPTFPTKDFSGLDVVISSKVEQVWCLLPADVGL